MSKRDTYHKFRVFADVDGNGYVEMDGARLRGVCRVEMASETDSVPTLTLTFLCGDLEVETDDSAASDGEAH